jgi:hypothetical protein
LNTAKPHPAGCGRIDYAIEKARKI